MNYDGLKLHPIFHSEISSSHLIFSIFDNHREIAQEFVNHFFQLPLTVEAVYREKPYQGQASVDVFVSGESGGVKTHVLIETKVHDYTSATPGQIVNYYKTANASLPEGHVRLAYLTQFNKENNPTSSGASTPGTITEFEVAQPYFEGKCRQDMKHINWGQFHAFLSQYRSLLSQEELLMVDLHSAWISAKTADDSHNNTVNIGERSILDYFEGLSLDLEHELPFGKVGYKENRRTLSLYLSQLQHEELNKILAVVRTLAASKSVTRKYGRQTTEATLEAAKIKLCRLADDVSAWRLLCFYSGLFDFAHSEKHVLLNGTGTRGFSVKVDISGKGQVSLCTLWANDIMEFVLKR